MAEKTDREIIKETARIAEKLEKFTEHLFSWILGMISFLCVFEVAPLLLGDVVYPEYDSAFRLIILLIWTAWMAINS
ncbi:MAG: hypothetical protein U9N04_02685 [Patescibacteria group bacterium]|nr:hypothetical protein [Patescibacteria group bacterium]